MGDEAAESALEALLAKDGISRRPLPSIPGYMVGDDGSVWSFHKWRGSGVRKIKPYLDQYGYLRIRLKKPTGGRLTKQVHRLVCEAFHGDPINRLHQVRHLDGDKTNNKSVNLAWGTAKDNAVDRDRHGTTARGERSGTAEVDDATVLAVVHLIGLGLPVNVVASFLSLQDATIRNWISGRHRECEALPDLLATIRRQRERAQTAEAQRDQLLAALDPNETKAAYIGEIKFTTVEYDEFGDEHTVHRTLEWTTTKEVMAMIRERGTARTILTQESER